MRIYETHAHMCIVCASTDNMSIICAYTHTYNAHNGIMRSSAHAYMRIIYIYIYKPNAHLRIKYASSAHMRHCASSALMHMCV